MDVLVGGKKVRLDAARSIGKGGEADVFAIGGGRALKLFKAPDHPDLEGDPAAQQAARERIDEHQRKLRAFPTGLSPRVVAPEELVTDTRGRTVLGYTMRHLTGAEVLLRYGERAFRQGTANDRVVGIFRDLHGTLAALHRRAVVVGDFNDLNVLVTGDAAYLIDADSMQFGGFLCRVFTDRFVDPLLCDPNAASLTLVRPHTEVSDWYAFAAMLMRSLLFVEPYGGVYRPADPASRITPAARPLHRITVFHPEVRYPKPAERWDCLPDDLLQHFFAVFVRDRREVFPIALLESIRWTRCLTCGREHARALCPSCAGAPPAAIREVTRVRGEVTSRRIFATSGRILEAAHQNGRLAWLYEEGGQVRREDGSVVFTGTAGPSLRLRIRGPRTVVGRGAQVVALESGRSVGQWAVETAGGVPAFDCHERHFSWVRDGRLMREGQFGPERIGDVLAGQTSIWLGPDFGFGFYRAGQVQVGFVFDPAHGTLNDSVVLPRITGQLTRAFCVFAHDRCWFVTASHENGRTVHRCVVISKVGHVLATADGTADDGTWLASAGGACAAGGALLVPTDDGIVRVEPDGASIVKTREFPDTEPFVDAACRLIAGADGLYVVDRHEIRHLTLASAAAPASR